MILATLQDGTPDGRLVVISPDRTHYALAPVQSLREAMENWAVVAQALGAVSSFPEPVSGARFAAPLLRAWQWLDGSAFPTHGQLMEVAFGHDPLDDDFPLMYQGMSHQFLGPDEDVRLPAEEHGIDFEGEYAVITDHVPMGTSAADALSHIKLVVQLNDWSLRAIAPREMKTGFGWVHAKPACSVAPFAVTPEALGAGWRDGRVALDLHITFNERPFGHANGAAMAYGFHELIAHAAFSRDLAAGTIIGSGTVSNPDYAEVGSSCISEVRAIEMIATGKPQTSFMRFGDRVRMEARAPDGSAPFGAIDQKVAPCR
ncbi:MAG: fumarylacetoacetate hydrolase family protein [Alphaproteobacteria bacterium]|nr:fumarylacetoacetate hydrolase family protein [Alphaproteobacteria bacterium]MBU0792996.1 fumarylacetoacetate hydrolase family protein [Alphaproteobacteria bacterium]MBU0875138.1 fumarylacetoacetate hydrolase family protein [Alphaproteobacteria bacterium]MBU1768887.1 fumarylacetoacetate hydrolase family protein [Alphaproteobacteria bacterium]